MTIARRLGGMERLFHQQNSIGSSNLCGILSYEGSLDLSTLPAALAKVQATYPRLLSSIDADPVLSYQPRAGAIPFRVIDRQDDEHWRLIVREEVRRHYEQERIFVTILQGADRGEIIVAADHTLADAKSVTAICECFIAGMNGRASPPVPIGEAWEERLPTFHKGWRAFFRMIFFIRNLFRRAPKQSLIFGKDVPSYHTQTAGFVLDEATLQKLKLAIEREKTNLNALFCAASMLAAFESFSAEEAGVVCLNTPVSLREQIDPPASPQELGLFVSAFLQWQPVNRTTDIWQLSRNIKERLRSGVQAGESILLGKLANGPKRPAPPKPDKVRKRFEHSICVSNPGRMPPFEDLPKARIVAFRT